MYVADLRILSMMTTDPALHLKKVLSKKQYKAEPADIFSCGIVLTAMLAGGK